MTRMAQIQSESIFFRLPLARPARLTYRSPSSTFSRPVWCLARELSSLIPTLPASRRNIKPVRPLFENYKTCDDLTAP